MNRPRLLLGECVSAAEVADRVMGSPVYPLDEVMPTARYRGTVIEFEDDGTTATVVGWQRNTARLQKLDVSLPTVITVRLTREGQDTPFRVASAALDNRFKGSKGILCSASFLERTLVELLEGEPFDPSLYQKIRIGSTHCFHLVEVLGGMVAYFLIANDRRTAGDLRSTYFEEEALDSLPGSGSDFEAAGCQRMTGHDDVTYGMTFTSLLDLMRFASDGAFSCSGNLNFQFGIDGGAAFNCDIPLAGNGFLHIGFQRALLTGIRMMRSTFGVAEHVKFYCTNLQPAALIGLLTQALAIRRFSNNYTYIMHALTAIQRLDNVPLCIGSVKSPVEMKKFFPGFTPDDLKG